MDRVSSVFKTVLAITLLLPALWLTVAAAETMPDGPSVPTGVVVASRLNLRAKPSKTATVLAVLPRHTRIVVYAVFPEWLEISGSGRRGYVWRAHVHILSPLEPSGAAAPAPFDPSRQAEDVAALKAQAERIGRRLQASTSRVTAFSKEEGRIVDDLDRIGRQLNRSEREVAAAQKELEALSAALDRNDARARRLAQEVATLETYAAKRLVALYKLHQLGKLPALASADSIYALLTRKHHMEAVLAADRKVWDALTEKQKALDAVVQTLTTQRQAHAAKTEALQVQLKTLADQRRGRAAMLDDIRKKKTLAAAAIAGLKEAAAALDKQIDAHSWEIHPAAGLVEAADAPFPSRKGLLPAPVEGKIVSLYGPSKIGPHQSASFRNGISIQADPGEPVRAVYGGRALYADWFKGYGNMIIIDHGNNYCSLYAHARELFKAKGDRVEPEEVIATVGDTGSMVGTTLYFEIRHHGKPVDPLAWLKRNQRRSSP